VRTIDISPATGPPDAEAQQLTELFRLLGDPTRVQIM
jgi:hypothetical protein